LIQGLLKTAHLLRCVSPCVAQRTTNVRLTTQALRALHLSIFEQPQNNGLFNNLLFLFFSLINYFPFEA
jgi:hypothetical protein